MTPSTPVFDSGVTLDTLSLSTVLCDRFHSNTRQINSLIASVDVHLARLTTGTKRELDIAEC